MAVKLTDTAIKALPIPATGNKIHYDTDVKGFGCRVTAAGARSFILNYRNQSGRERRITIGDCQDWKTVAAREEAKALKRRVDRGEDPLSQIEEAKAAKTVDDLCKRFTEDHIPKKRESTARDYKAYIKNHILPAMKNMKVADVTYSDVDSLHRKITRGGAPYVANRVHSLLSKMFTESIKWKWRTDNPCKGIERNDETKRQRYLSITELSALGAALTALDDKQAANIIRLLLLTGARRNEVQSARWDQFDLTEGVWEKPASTTKQKKLHRIPLSAPARQLLSEIHKETGKGDFVFPAGSEAGHRVEIKNEWKEVCVAGGVVKTETVKGADGKEKTVIVPSARIHDLRHTYASVLASAGLSLPVIGALLGHSQPATTARYAHLMDDPLRQATERVGAIVMPAAVSAEVIPLRGK